MAKIVKAENTMGFTIKIMLDEHRENYEAMTYAAMVKYLGDQLNELDWREHILQANRHRPESLANRTDWDMALDGATINIRII